MPKFCKSLAKNPDNLNSNYPDKLKLSLQWEHYQNLKFELKKTINKINNFHKIEFTLQNTQSKPLQQERGQNLKLK